MINIIKAMDSRTINVIEYISIAPVYNNTLVKIKQSFEILGMFV